MNSILKFAVSHSEKFQFFCPPVIKKSQKETLNKSDTVQADISVIFQLNAVTQRYTVYVMLIITPVPESDMEGYLTPLDTLLTVCTVFSW
jgi:hypothetical protein